MRRLEESLMMIDQNDNYLAGEGKVSKFLYSPTLDEHRDELPPQWSESRPHLLRRLEKTALEYAELLLKTRELVAMNRPADRDYNSLVNFMVKDEGQLFESELSVVFQKEDMITLRPGRERAFLDHVVDVVLWRLRRFRLVVWMFRSKDTKEKTNDTRIRYYTTERIANLVHVIHMATIMVLIIVPIWLLYQFAITDSILRNSNALIVILVFTIAFATVMSAFTQAKRHEVLASAAA
ncbi:MAG: hypothetical protein MMC23_005417 [Stictis urceolatum]|nr:hypothetical protein [Stictis urceolata]